MNRDAAADAGLHREIDSRLDSAVPDLRAACRHQFLVGGDYALAIGDGGIDNLRRDGGSADQLGNDVDIRMRHHVAPVGRLEHGTERGWDVLRIDGAAADCDDLQLVAEFERDLVAVFGQDRKGAGADIAQPDNADVDFLHIFFMIAAGRVKTAEGRLDARYGLARLSSCDSRVAQ